MTGIRNLSRLAAALLLAAVCANAAAQGQGRGPGGTPGSTGGGPPPPIAGPSTGGAHTLVAPLRFAFEGTLVIDGGRVDAPSSWPRFLASGMWLRAEGDWDGEVFRASALVVTRPAYFSYYLGPAVMLDLGTGWIEAWFAAADPSQGVSLFELRRVAPAAQTLALARIGGGRWLALPPGLRPPPPPGADGWMLVHGSVDDGAVHWHGMEPFP